MGDDKVHKQKMPPDGGWGWMVVLGSFVCYFIADGWAYSFGVIFTELLDYFGEGKGKTATIGALIYAVPLLISPLPCALCNLYGCRPIAIIGGCICAVSFVISMFANSVEMLMITIGTSVSIGLALTYVPAILVVMFYFEKRRGLATGLAVTGSGIGAFAFPPLLEYLMSKFLWRGTMLLLGGLSFNIVAAGALFFPLRERQLQDTNHENMELLRQNRENQETTSTETVGNDTRSCGKVMNEIALIKNSMCDLALYKNWIFIAFCFSSLICYLWTGTPYVYLVDLAMLHGFTSEKGALLLSAIGIGRTVGQITLGALADYERINKMILYASSIFICGVATILLPLCDEYLMFVIYSLVFGFFISVTYTLQTLCMVDICGLDKASNAFGVLQLVQGIATILGTPIPGWFYDYTESYDPPLYVAGFCITVSALLLVPLPFIMRKRHSHQHGSLSSVVNGE